MLQTISQTERFDFFFTLARTNFQPTRSNQAVASGFLQAVASGFLQAVIFSLNWLSILYKNAKLVVEGEGKTLGQQKKR